MAHGSTPPYIYGQPRARPAWRAALRRGAILGSVIALHLAIVALVLRPCRHTVRHIPPSMTTVVPCRSAS